MAKQKKKRTKKYSGADAATSNKPSVTKVTAVNRSKLGQWWFEKKRIVKPVAIAAVVLFVIVWLLTELIRFVFFS